MSGRNVAVPTGAHVRFAPQDFISITAELLCRAGESCTAKIRRDNMSVIDNELKAYGIEDLRIADSSLMPRITTGNTIAPCVIVEERAGDLTRATHGLLKHENAA